MKELEGKRILVTGGTGSLGQTLVKRILTGEMGRPASVTVFSRDESKQHYMRLHFMQKDASPTLDGAFLNSRELLNFRIGDVRDYSALVAAMRDADIVFNAAALKHVSSCEYFPFEAVLTNVYGAANIVRAIRENQLPVKQVIGVSTDKACKPINVLGMTKALQERVLIEANRDCPDVQFSCVRYGNVIASRGSIIPLFVDLIKNDKAITITMPEMTRFLLSLDKAVDTVFETLRSKGRGETFVPRAASAKIVDVATALMGNKKLPIIFTGIRPGEKIHEIMVSEEECFRTVSRGDYYVILPVLPELRGQDDHQSALTTEYSSRDNNMTGQPLLDLLTGATSEIEQFRVAA
jgi:FlaA1/EpsC-like NDP-sugar epimerase